MKVFGFMRWFFIVVLILFVSVLRVSAGEGGAVPAAENGERSAFETRLLNDWLFQAEGLDAGEIFSDDQSNDGARRVTKSVLDSIAAEQIERDGEVSAETKEKLAPLVTWFEALQTENRPAADPRWKALFEEACRLRRAYRLAELAASHPDWIYAKHYVLGGSHYAYTEDVTDAQFVERLDRRPGGALCRLTIHPDGATESETLFETKTGTLRDPEVSYDGEKIIFAKRESFDADDFHLFEYRVGSKEIRQLTHGTGFADIEPVYLPSGDILFGSTRCVQITDCLWTDVVNLYVCDADGRFMRRVSYDQVTVNYPKVTDDGRVLYTRWDYNDRGQIYPQGLFVMNPDGTGQTAFYGNNSWFPTSILHARGIPDSGGKVIAIASGHHTRQRGKLLFIDRAHGTEEDEGCHLVAPIRPSGAPHIDAYGQDGEQFQYPYPLDERNFIVAYKPEPVASVDGRESYDPPFGLYWMDADGNRELLAWDPAVSSGQPVPLYERPIPILRPSTVDYAAATGEYYVQDVYAGPGLSGIERGTVKRLRVVALEFRAAGVFSNANSGPSGGAMIATPVGVNNATWDVKRVLGEVPVEEDGSARFVVPARTPVYFQLLDERGDTVQTMRSWSTLQPNEVFGCIGCHEPKGTTLDNIGAPNANMPNADASASSAQETNVGESAAGVRNQTLALRKPAAIPEPITPNAPGRARDWGFSFVRDIQPILDRHCVACHDGGLREAVLESKEYQEAGRVSEIGIDPAHPFSLTADDALLPLPYPKNPYAGRAFSRAYLNLTDNGNFGAIVRPINVQESPVMLAPYNAGAAKSPLLTLLRNPDEAHREVHLSDAELRTLALWVDLLVPYCGEYAECADWPANKEAEYAYNLLKREAMATFEVRNIAEQLDVLGGKKALPEFAALDRVEDFGRERRAAFLESFAQKRTLHAGPTESGAKQDQTAGIVPCGLGLLPLEEAFPLVRTNSVFGYRADCEAANLIDGKKRASAGAGSEDQAETLGCWSPNKRRDAWCAIDLGRDTEIGRLVITPAVGGEYDGFWESARVVFSDGSAEELTFEPGKERWTFTFPKRTTRTLRLENFCGPFTDQRFGIEELEFFGE